jgi:hypothetical protein
MRSFRTIWDIGICGERIGDPMITRRDVAEKVEGYLRSRVSLDTLVDWAEHAIMEEGFDPGKGCDLRDAIARLGIADVREFGLTIEDCRALLRRIGYQLDVQLTDLLAS